MKKLLLNMAFIALILIGALASPDEQTSEDSAVLWVPKADILHAIFHRTQWRMSVEEFKKAFQDSEFSEKDWQLGRSSFRKIITVKYPNTEAQFEFSGVVDNQSPKTVALTSALVSFKIRHPIKVHPDTPFRRPPDSIHYRPAVA